MLMIQAQSLGLCTHAMGGFDPEKAKTTFKIPEPYQPVTMIALGYAGNLAEIPEELQKRETSPRNRKPLQNVVFKGKFEIPGN
jgi:nitroreductase